MKSAGHNIAGLSLCEGGVVIDLSAMKGIHVDPRNRTARVEPGVTWAELDRATQLHGLATPGGIVSTTGTAGFTLGGGGGSFGVVTSFAYRLHALPSEVLAGAVCYAMDDDASRVREAYRGNYARLARLKARFDPDNAFRLNQNVVPVEAR